MFPSPFSEQNPIMMDLSVVLLMVSKYLVFWLGNTALFMHLLRTKQAVAGRAE
jgi:hypothetical protein